MQTLFPLVDVTPLLLIILGAVFVHACFQLSVSVLTLLSSHTIGRRMPNTRLLNLSFWYVLGVVTMITLLELAAIATLRWGLAHNTSLTLIVTLSIIPLVALFVVLGYYRRGKGTQLWLPRPAAEYITTRAKKTRSSVESFGLGLTTVVTELPFVVAPLAIMGLALQGFSADRWFAISLFYAVLVVLPLVFVAFYISSGHKVSSVQRWRESSKTFLQWTSAIALVILTVYLAVLQMEPRV